MIMIRIIKILMMMMIMMITIKIMMLMMITLMTNISAPGAQWQQQPTSTNSRSKYFQIPIVYDGSLDFLGIAPFYGHFQDSVGVLLFKLSNPNFR